MTTDAPHDTPDTVSFRDESGAEQNCERDAAEAVGAFFAFVAERRGDRNQVFSVELESEQAGL